MPRLVQIFVQIKEVEIGSAGPDIPNQYFFFLENKAESKGDLRGSRGGRAPENARTLCLVCPPLYALGTKYLPGTRTYYLGYLPAYKRLVVSRVPR